MKAPAWERWAGLGAIAFAAAFAVVEFVLQTGEVGLLRGDGHHTDTEIASFYGDRSNAEAESGSHMLFFYGALLLVPFFAALASRLARHGGEGTAIVVAGGATVVGLLVVGMSLYTGLSFGVAESETFMVNPDVARTVYEIGYAVLMGGFGLGSVPIAAASLIGLRTGALPRWLAWFGLVTGVLLLASWIYMPLYLFVAWVGAAGAVTAYQRTAPARVPQPA